MTAAAVATAPTSERSGARVAGLDGVRGLAMAMVFVHHIIVRVRDPFVDGLWISVDLFFVLSGFLITMSMLADPDLNHFMRRRFWRIAPAMVVFLVAYVVWSVGAADADQRMEWAFAAATQWSNVQGAIGPPFSPHIGHLWSLSAEVQFYALWGVCLWWMLRRRWPRPVIVGLLLVLFVLSWAERALLLDGGSLWNRLYLAPDTRAAALLFGCVIGLAYGWGWLRFRWLIGVLTIPAVAVTLLFVIDLTFLEPRTYRWALTVVALAWGVVVASAALRLPTPVRPLLELPPLVWLGRVSYSVYLYHLVIIAEVAKTRSDDPIGVALVAVPLTLVIGCASYFLIERPLLSASSRARLRARFPGYQQA